MKFGQFNNMPERLPDERLEQVVQLLRNLGNCETCVACKVCFLNGKDSSGKHICYDIKLMVDGLDCPNKGTTLVDYMIRMHIPMALSIAKKFSSAIDIEEAIAVALLQLTKGVNNYQNLVNNNLAAYLTSVIGYGLRHHIRNKPMVRVPDREYARTKTPVQVTRNVHKVGRAYMQDLVLDIRATFKKIIKTERENLILHGLLEGSTLKEMAKECGISISAVAKHRDDIYKRFIDTWKGE